jgi:hypothetical protein
MYYIVMSLMSAAFLFAGFTHSDGLPLWNFVIAIGGVYLGHVVTEALNHKDV